MLTIADVKAAKKTLIEQNFQPAMKPKLYLVSCVGQKMSKPAPARELYVSDWFRKARAFVESRGALWVILSAKYGVVMPDQVIEPYDLSLRSLSRGQQLAWATVAAESLLPAIDAGMEIVFLSGLVYREPLGWVGITGTSPLQGLGIGQQKRWLKSNTLDGKYISLEDMGLGYGLIPADFDPAQVQYTQESSGPSKDKAPARGELDKSEQEPEAYAPGVGLAEGSRTEAGLKPVDQAAPAIVGSPTPSSSPIDHWLPGFDGGIEKAGVSHENAAWQCPGFQGEVTR